MSTAHGFPVFSPKVDVIYAIDAVLDMLKPLPDTIPGGEIIRDPGMGVLCDSALTLVENISPNKSEQERTKAFKLAIKSLNSVGLIGVHEASVFPQNIALYRKSPLFLVSPHPRPRLRMLIVGWLTPGS